MRINKLFVITLLMLFNLAVQAQSITKQDKKEPDILPIRASVKQTLTLSKQGKRDAVKHLAQLEKLIVNNKSALAVATEKPLNAAEQYLVFIAKAYLAKYKQDYNVVIELLDQADEHKNKIAKAQLSEPDFFQLEELYTQSYELLGDFDQAYQHKRMYLRKYLRYEYEKNQKLLSQLKEKYQTEQKIEENKQLEEENNKAQAKLAQIEGLYKAQQRNIILLVFVAIIFIFIIVREFRIRRKLIVLGRIDHLTQLLNRKSLFYYGEQFLNNKKAPLSTLSAIYFDIDHFKQINDNYGHPIGDEVIKTVAKIGNEVLRTRDVFARIGGEEFVILLPEESLAKAKAVAEHLRQKIAHYNFSSLGITTKITASFGIASNEKNINDFDHLVNNADLAMYQAKKQGRNCVVCFTEDIEIANTAHVRNVD